MTILHLWYHGVTNRWHNLVFSQFNLNWMIQLNTESRNPTICSAEGSTSYIFVHSRVARSVFINMNWIYSVPILIWSEFYLVVFIQYPVLTGPESILNNKNQLNNPMQYNCIYFGLVPCGCHDFAIPNAIATHNTQ